MNQLINKQLKDLTQEDYKILEETQIIITPINEETFNLEDKNIRVSVTVSGYKTIAEILGISNISMDKEQS